MEDFIRSLWVDTHLRTVCPECSGERRKANQKDLVIDRKDDCLVYYCQHCQVKGAIKTKKEFKVQAINPQSYDFLHTEHYDFLSSRGISKMTADTMQLFSSEKFFSRLQKKTKAIGFPYYKAGKIVGAKYRSIESKDFTSDSGSGQEFFGIDNIDKTKPIIIVEGEIDALSAIEAGLLNVLSVPSGAPIKVSDGKVSAEEDKRFGYVWSAFDVLTAVPYVTIATDNDTAGQALAEELARRIGKDKCRIAKFELKDLNEVLLKVGADEVKRIIESAEPYPVAGLSEASKFAERVEDLWGKGNGRGESTGYSNLDEIYTVAQGQLTIVTGYPSSGKSNFVDQLMVNLARNKSWKFALCSFENAPEVHISRLIEIKTEKRFFEGRDRMTKEEKDEAFSWVNEHFMFLDSEGSEPSTIDSILERARIAVARSGVRGVVIDPYNYIENKSHLPETEFISGMLTRVQAFAKAYGVHVWFVAHPSKITRSGMDLPRPDGMAISGSMAWWAKADCGLTIHRADKAVEVAVWKCRYRWIGTQGETKLGYDKTTGTYFQILDDF